ncbi:hypothetical protein ACN2XU_11955 [Primorskyibacter sp. 2E107]|uniref:hypothetical protein n=1 Tax=Primorskyibacter sp. 2E107 TaxID=3403458 RepID=UPI003AF6D580
MDVIRAGYGMIVNYIAGSIVAIIIGLFGFAFMDYHEQAIRAGVSTSDFGLSGWTQSFVERGKAAARRAQLEARRDGPLNSYFPDSVAGWQRVDWAPSYEIALKEQHNWQGEPSDTQRAIEKDRVGWAISAAQDTLAEIRDKRAARRAAVYLKGDKILVLKARFIDPTNSGGLASFVAMQMDNDFSTGTLAAAYSGVAFNRLRTNNWTRELHGRGYWLEGMISEELELRAMTNAAISEVGQVLKKIDFAGLRTLVDIPHAVASEKQTDLTAELRRKQNEARLQAAEDRRKIDRELERMASRAKGSGQQEVCLNKNGKRYCAWVD